MDWYHGSGMDDLVVPNDGGSDRLPSPDSWSRWGISASECLQTRNKCFSTYPQEFTNELNFTGDSLFDEFEIETSVNEKDPSSSSSVCEGLSDDSHQQATLSYNRANNQLEDLAGLEQMDDIFLSSLLDDLPGLENVDKYCYFSPDSNGMLPTDNISTNTILESQSISSSVHSAGSSKYIKTHAFSPSLGSEKDTTSQSIRCSSEQKDCLPVKAARVFSPSEEGSMNELVSDETSVEESVLHELEMVMTQLTEKTRICFRDALYRLANNTKGNHATQSQDGDHTIKIEKPSSWTIQDETLRSGSNEGTELKTNTIDRAIANLLFNEMDFNAEGLSGGAQLDAKQEVIGMTGQLADNAYRPQISHSHHLSVFPHDAEVPILGHRDMHAGTDHQIHKSFSSCHAGGKRKTPMREFESTTGF